MIPRVLTALLITLSFFPHLSEAKVVDERIYLVPAGNVDKRVPEKLKDKLPGLFPMNVKAAIDPPQEMPQAAYDPSRKQYDAQAVVDEISNHIIVALTNERALIVTDADLYTPELNFVFGLADPKKGVCIISLARLKTDSNQALFNERALKEAAHELGHSWNVPHCPDRRCVMFFSNSLADTDRKQDHFCYKCRIGLDNRHGSGGMLGKKIEKIMSR